MVLLKLKVKNFQNKWASTDEEIYNLGIVIGAILISEPTEIKKLDDYTLNEG